MSECWKDHKSRPSFKTLATKLEHLLIDSHKKVNTLKKRNIPVII